MRHRADDDPDDETRIERLRLASESERMEAQHAADAILPELERWGKRVERWGPRILVTIAVTVALGGVGLAFGWRLTSPSTASTALRVQLQGQMDTVATILDSLDSRTDKLEATDVELTRYIRFLVAAKCLELDEQSKRDLVISGISCGRISR